MNNSMFMQYTTDYISGVMSLRVPQKKSLEILDEIITNTNLIENNNYITSKEYIKTNYPTFTDFERSFISLAFSLATGVGKTRLMGAFITYLYTNYNIKNFLVVAPSTTIYEKLKKDLGSPETSKYIFKGLGCFDNPPRVVSDDDFDRHVAMFDSDITIYVYNISKFDKENTKFKAFSEIIGKSFYEQLADMKDLVVIMDESHHYRADKGMETINNLNPILGLELTATPYVNIKNKQVQFKNVVYDYSLAKAIADGYTRVPYAVTRTDMNFYEFGDENIDKLMLNDGITCHKMIKEKLRNYSFITNKRLVKPFMLVVCKDTEHASKIENYIRSNDFEGGFYRNKTIVINSKLSGAETEANTKALLSVEDVNNPIEIVIHVNMLKEGWDVNNLYTIVPLRTAVSKILREQMVGRGLRLPYGERTGEKEIDSVMLTAHDKFNEIIEEAQRGDSIFNKENTIIIQELENEKNIVTQLNFSIPTEDFNKLSSIIQGEESDKNVFSNIITNLVRKEVENSIYNYIGTVDESSQIHENIKNNVENIIKNDVDYGFLYEKNKEPIQAWLKENIEKTRKESLNKFIIIPKIKTEREEGEYYFEDFNIDLTNFNHKPIENDVLIRNLIDMRDEQVLTTGYINFEATNPGKLIVEQLRKKSEIDYEKNNELIYKLITQVINHYERLYNDNGMKNIVMMYKKDIAFEIYIQMMKHFVRNEGIIKQEVFVDRPYNIKSNYTYNIIKNLFDLYTSDRDGKITSILFDGITKGVFSETKFDSEPELLLARQLEREKDFVETWLRPNIDEFDITYNNGKRYEPDFVVESKDCIYLVEVKADNQLESEDVIDKMNEALKYCKTVSEYEGILNIKKWKYVLIPSSKITSNSTFKYLVGQYTK